MLQRNFRLLLLAILLIGSSAVYAQDRIYLNDGSQINGKVKEINSRSIVYKRMDAQDGPDYILSRNEVSRIQYENGVEEKMIGSSSSMKASGKTESSTNRKSQGNVPYGKTILSFAPIQMTNESPAGMGLSVEHFLDHDNIFSIYLPVAFGFYEDNASTSGYESKNRVYTYLYPGLKIYPGGSNRKVSYSVGPSFGLGFGSRYFSHTAYDPVTGYPTYYETEEDDFIAGFIVNNGLNIQPTRALYIGLEFGLGIKYYAAHSDAFDEPLVQFQFKMGYRF